MEMEDHSNHQQYDLRQLVNGVRSTHFPSMPSPHPTPEDFFPAGHRNLTALVSNQNQHYDMMMLGRGIVLDDFASPSTVAAATPATTTSPETGGCIGGDASTGRWPRQETLTLLEIRSRLDPKFKEANQKGPLWDEVSRIMSEEHGYQRSGKKCREKFENLYKYYKKTKEGKAGRHDGKHYRFFRQLEALYGDNSNQTTSSTVRTFQGPSQTNQDNMFYSHHNNLKHYSDSLSLTNSTDFDTSSSDHSNEAGNIESVEIRRRKRKSGRSWKVKIKDFIDSQVKKLVEKQEEWLDKLVKTMEEKEKERMLRDEEWRKQEAIRIEREHKFWAKERAWIEARDAALMETLHNIAGGREMKAGEGLNVITAEFQNNIQNEEDENENEIRGADSWHESEVARLQQLRNEMETWEEVATKMACFGYQRTAFMCKKKWESISKKHKENSSRSCFYFNNNDQASMYNQGSSGYCDVSDQRHEIGKLQRNDGSSPSNSNVAPGDTCFPFLMSEGGNLWENFGLKINKSNQNH